MAKKTTRRDRVVAAGQLLFGETRWQSPLARLSGLSPALMQKIADGTREVTDDVYSKVAQALLGEIERMNKATNRVGEIAGAMLADLDGEK
ncbi:MULTISPECIES: hypothetical protein [Bradyrhizobium]|jgi:hypothetical protein|uniref:Uncharacterized protein n=2 Tax=Nitrobacteraceae TaxID=41294 RepID=A0A7C9REG4_9BRAD|nr:MULTISPECIES: hypothetical protein [Bradyrhizobium]MBX3494287.1 hypothetical protein [Parvibaculum sp.]MCW5702829.1 hypothetical protein [Bradyrhizobium sp.]NGX95463.1 hypothetical protein [Candidatus Afipia apatlaquensis]OYU86519.1 MAG: hypothetical protein CFE29_29305 [Bradyrhizobiaceae bacterium PARB1]HEV7326625.1 hypothetical protein [Bosea sp. (in: a-proteobacteria)]